MNLNKNVTEVLKALDRAKAHVPQDWEYVSNDENVMSQVMRWNICQNHLVST